MNFSEVKEVLYKRYSHLGVKKNSDGTELIGEVPEVAPYAFLHSIYHGLSNKEILDIENLIGFQLPLAVKKMYETFNGLTLFVDTLNIYGLRKNNNRSIESSWQPYDIRTYNVEERIEGATESMLFIGGYSLNGNKVYFNMKNECVYLCSKDNISPLAKWSSLEEWLTTEVNRLINLHNDKGLNIPFRSTVPIGGEDTVNKLIKLYCNIERKPYWYKETIKLYKKDSRMVNS